MSRSLDLAQFEGHTPGPWIYSPHTTIDVRGAQGRELAETRNGGYTQAEQNCNARLLAAAPALLAECRRLTAERAQLVAALRLTLALCDENGHAARKANALLSSLREDA